MRLGMHMNRFLLPILTVGVLSADEETQWLSDFWNNGELYASKNNPFIQKVDLFGRLHYQFSHVDGRSGGQDFDQNGGELRRFRMGAKIEFLNHFTLGARVNLEQGGFRNDKLGYDSFDEMYLAYEVKDTFGVDELEVTAGRMKVNFGGEEHLSSKVIKTIERSNLNNFFAPDRATGATVRVENGPLEVTTGLYTTHSDSETLGSFDGGLAYYLSGEYDLPDAGDLVLDLMYANPEGDESERDAFDGIEWATALTYFQEEDRYTLLANTTFGETQGGANVWGLVLLPTYYLIEDQVELAFRYQYARASENTLSAGSGSRGVRAAAKSRNVSVPKGDANHTFYGGVNVYLAKKNKAKLMFGVEYETLDSEADGSADLDSVTLWGAFRAYF